MVDVMRGVSKQDYGKEGTEDEEMSMVPLTPESLSC